MGQRPGSMVKVMRCVCFSCGAEALSSSLLWPVASKGLEARGWRLCPISDPKPRGVWVCGVCMAKEVSGGSNPGR